MQTWYITVAYRKKILLVNNFRGFICNNYLTSGKFLTLLILAQPTYIYAYKTVLDQNESVKMIFLLHLQGLKTHRRESKKNYNKALLISSGVRTIVCTVL